jgi:TRAP-type C4-dicarboxylate transport system permease small subunit
MLRWLDRAVETALGLLATALVATAFAQVVARYVFARPFTWVLELDVLLLVWATLLAGYVGVRRNAHMAVDFVVARWRPAHRRRAALASLGLSLLFVALLGWKSFEVIDAMEGISFTSIPLGQPALYWALPVGSALMLVALARALAERLRRAD